MPIALALKINQKASKLLKDETAIMLYKKV